MMNLACDACMALERVCFQENNIVFWRSFIIGIISAVIYSSFKAIYFSLQMVYSFMRFEFLGRKQKCLWSLLVVTQFGRSKHTLVN